MARRVIEHNDWSGGEFGRAEAWRARMNQFTGTNMLVYRTGELGVRPGLRDVTPTTGVGANVNGQTFLITRAPTASGGSVKIIFGINDDIYTFNPSATSISADLIGTTNAAPTSLCDSVWLGTRVYFVQPNGTPGAYQIDGTTLTALTNSPTGNSITQFGDRLVIARNSGQPVNNLHYNGLTTGVSDFTKWTVGTDNSNLIPVGDAGNIFKLITQRGHLVIAKQHTGHWIITGQLGVSEQLRQQVTNIQGPDAYQSMGRSQNGLLWFADTSGISGHPMAFDGTQMVSIDHLDISEVATGLGTFTQANAAIPFASDDDTGVLIHAKTPSTGTAQQQSLLLSDNVWTSHNFPVQLNIAQGTSLPYQFRQDPGAGTAETLNSTDSFILTDGGSGSVPPKFYGWTPRMDRPGSETVLANACPERAGDASSAQVSGNWTSAEMHLQDADEFMVQGVVVDFRSWNTGGSLTNHWDLQVDCLRPYDNDSPITSLTGAWDEVGVLSSTAGTLKRQVIMFGDQGYGNGYQLRFTNCRGVAFQRVQVILDTVKFRGV